MPLLLAFTIEAKLCFEENYIEIAAVVIVIKNYMREAFVYSESRSLNVLVLVYRVNCSIFQF